MISIQFTETNVQKAGSQTKGKKPIACPAAKANSASTSFCLFESLLTFALRKLQGYVAKNHKCNVPSPFFFSSLVVKHRRPFFPLHSEFEF